MYTMRGEKTKQNKKTPASFTKGFLRAVKEYLGLCISLIEFIGDKNFFTSGSY